jgi:hypothetical protein
VREAHRAAGVQLTAPCRAPASAPVETIKEITMNPKRDEPRRLVIRRETLRELSPNELESAHGGAITAKNSDVSNCCCQPTSNQGADSCSIAV